MNLITNIQNGFVGLTKEIESHSKQKFQELVNSAHTLVPIFENGDQDIGSEEISKKQHFGKRSSFAFGSQDQMLVPEAIASLYGSTKLKGKQEDQPKSTTLIRRHSISGSQVRAPSSRGSSKIDLKKTKSLQPHREASDTCDEATRSKIEQWFSKSRSAA
mmetsp:Transcript_33476/g.75106  ORF Transcript_33476/g.75106 Transcript_33476/m.75106 type:complete len:160 (-) Transcript_33476:1896-2375(-)|eukprot:766715-Hanusia_phi.AAC.4